MIATKASDKLRRQISANRTSWCSGLYLSARWFVLADVARKGVNLIILPDSESAQYCTSDLYNLIEGDAVFFLPDSGKKVERSNYKSSLGVQRTSAVGEILSGKKDPLYIVTYPDALSERFPAPARIKDRLL